MRAVFLAFLLMSPATAAAQGIDGYVSLLADALPGVQQNNGDERTVAELRARVFIEHRRTFGNRWRLTLAGFADGLLADRVDPEITHAGIVRPQEVYLEAAWAKADIRVGFSRVVWGRLDELLPTDVVNPQDLTRFFLESRTEGRMPVGMVRGRWLPSDRFALEGIYIPIFRRGRFDQLDEATAPFNLAPRVVCQPTLPSCLPLALRSHEPRRAWSSAQGGARASITTGRFDWAISVYRGFEPLPVYELKTSSIPPAGPLAVDERFPRFTMIGGDFETVRGKWGVRGEVAGFVERTLQAFGQVTTVKGRALEAGLGVDRRAGGYRISGNILVLRRADALEFDSTDVTLVTVVDRSFSRETRTLRAFAVYNPTESSAFARIVVAQSLRDNLWLEGSAGWFTGDGEDALSRFSSRDFLYLRLKAFF